MMPRSSEIIQLIETVFLEHGTTPLNLHDLHKTLRRKGKALTLDKLRAILSDRKVFTTLAHDRYVLRDQFAAPTTEEAPAAALYLANLARARDRYVVLDIETNGLEAANPQHQIVQLALLRVEAGLPTQFFEWFVQCPPEQINQTIRQALHLDEAKLARIAAAPTLAEQLPAIRAAIGDDPLVIHNARFDMSFLQRDMSDLPPAVDTMELALLVLPHAPNHRLETLAHELGIVLEAIDAAGIAGVPDGHKITASTLHDATTDVLVLHAVYCALLARLDTLPDLPLIAALLPELIPAGVEIPVNPTLGARPLDPWPPRAALEDATASALLDRLLAATNRPARPSQQQMVAIIAEALQEDTSRLIEAPTGTGKTLGYVVPAVWAAIRDGRRIGIATAVKNLQDQVADEIARLQPVVPVRAQVLKGSASYLCLRNLQQALQEEPATIERRYLLAFLARWATSGPPATLDELPYWLQSTFPEMRPLVPEMAVDTRDCTQTACPFYAPCHHLGAYRRAETADVILLNHSLWLCEPNAMPAIDALMIDEAHNLEDRATSAYQEEVSEGALRALLYRLAVPGTQRGALPRILRTKPDDQLRTLVKEAQSHLGQALALLANLRDTLAEFVAACDDRARPATGAQFRLHGRPARVHPTRWPPVQQALDQLWFTYIGRLDACLRRIAQALPAAEPVLVEQVRAVADKLRKQADLLRTILDARHADLVTWIAVQTEGQRAGWAFVAAPIAVAPLLAQAYAQLRTVVLTSATLTTGPRDFGFFLDRLGLRDTLRPSDAYALDGVLPYADNALVAFPSYLRYTPDPSTIKSFVEELADELALFCDYTDGRALVLFTARTRMETVWSQAQARLEAAGIAPLIQLKDSSRRRLTEQFANQKAVLFGLRSFWEGVDVPGDRLSFVLMEKLPFPLLTDPVQIARREAVAQGGREFQEYLFPLMIIQFKQGFGRLIRTETDRGAVILYDRRVARKSYLAELLRALPGYQPRDIVAERSRAGMYRLIDERLPGLINREAKQALLDALPDVLATDIEALVARLALPAVIADDAYDQWRPTILEAIKELYNHDGFRSPEQEATLRAILTGRDALAVLPTGAGKSLCFQLPALLRPGLTVVCSPLIALMRDQIEKLQEKGIELAAALMSGQSAAEREETLARARAGTLKLLYLAPERLRDPVVLAALAASPVRQIVVDEAHCVALWGPSFRPDFLALPQLYSLLPNRPPVAAFTATATPAIRATIEQALELNNPQFVRAPIDRPELRLVVFDRNHPYHPVRSKNDQLRQLLLLVQTADRTSDSMLIYVATTAKAEELARLLQIASFDARAYHGKMTTQERNNISTMFMESMIPIVVCTKAFGMGIDKSSIRYVVHYQVPGDLESYAQEVGRAGRDQATSYAVLLYHTLDERIQQYFIDQSRPDTELLSNLWHWISAQPPRFLLNPLQVREQFDIEDLDLRRAIYLLERAGMITRRGDRTVHANVTLLEAWPEALANATPGDRSLLDALLAQTPQLASERVDLDLPVAAAAIDCAPEDLETALVNLAVAGGCLYRPWEKGYDILRHVEPSAPLPPISTDAVAAQEVKLQRMRAFVHDQRCRWQGLRVYFGEDAGQPCGTCDRCDREQIYPWSNTTARDVPDVSDFVSLGTTLIDLVAWNERRVREHGSLFSKSTLLRILRAEQYALMQHTPPGPGYDARLTTLRACPYWGVCRTMARSRAELDGAINRLMAEGYIVIDTVAREDGGQYEVLRLTDHGRASMLANERLAW